MGSVLDQREEGRREERKAVKEAMGHRGISSSVAKPTCMGRFNRHQDSWGMGCDLHLQGVFPLENRSFCVSDSWRTKHVNPQCVPGERARGINITISLLISLLSDFYSNFTSLSRVRGAWPGVKQTRVGDSVCRSGGSTSSPQGCAGCAPWGAPVCFLVMPLRGQACPSVSRTEVPLPPTRQKPAGDSVASAPSGFLAVPCCHSE